MTVSKADLDRVTRNWLKNGTIPAMAATTRRMWAERMADNNAGREAREFHLAVAAEWDRIEAKFPEKVRKAYEAKRDYHLHCISEVARIGHLDADKQEEHRIYHQALADEWQKRADTVGATT